MKTLRLIGILILAAALWAQSTGTVTVNSSVVATGVSSSETLTCTVSPTPSKNGATVLCSRGPTLGALAQHNEDVSVAGESSTWQLNLNGNAFTLMLTQSNPAGTLSWQVAMNGTSKSGTF